MCQVQAFGYRKIGSGSCGLAHFVYQPSVIRSCPFIWRYSYKKSRGTQLLLQVHQRGMFRSPVFRRERLSGKSRSKAETSCAVRTADARVEPEIIHELCQFEIDTAVAGLEVERDRKQAEVASKYLLENEESAYKKFTELQETYVMALQKHENAEEKPPTDLMPLRFMETVGIECAAWPAALVLEDHDV